MTSALRCPYGAPGNGGAVRFCATLLAAAWVLGCATWVQTGSLHRGPCTWVGARPHTDDLGHDWAATVQIETDWPSCPKSR